MNTITPTRLPRKPGLTPEDTWTFIEPGDESTGEYVSLLDEPLACDNQYRCLDDAFDEQSQYDAVLPLGRATLECYDPRDGSACGRFPSLEDLLRAGRRMGLKRVGIKIVHENRNPRQPARH